MWANKTVMTFRRSPAAIRARHAAHNHDRSGSPAPQSGQVPMATCYAGISRQHQRRASSRSRRQRGAATNATRTRPPRIGRNALRPPATGFGWTRSCRPLEFGRSQGTTHGRPHQRRARACFPRSSERVRPRHGRTSEYDRFASNGTELASDAANLVGRPNALHTPHVVTRQTSALGTRRGRRGVRRRDHRLQRLRLERDRRRRVLDHPLAGWSERTSLVTIEGTAAPIARVSRRMEKAVDPFRFRRMRQPPCGRVAAARQRPSGAELAAT
jgi:hypothetical protein